MKKLEVDYMCKECGNIKSDTVYICDTCGKQLSHKGYIIREVGSFFPLKLTAGEIDYDFCNWKCILNFIIAELTKEK